MPATAVMPLRRLATRGRLQICGPSQHRPATGELARRLDPSTDGIARHDGPVPGDDAEQTPATSPRKLDQSGDVRNVMGELLRRRESVKGLRPGVDDSFGFDDDPLRIK